MLGNQNNSVLRAPESDREMWAWPFSGMLFSFC